MTGTLTFAGCTWPLQASSLDSMRNAAQEPWQESIVEFLDRWWSDDERIRVNTSGSTGDPRPLWHAKANLVESARRTIQHFGLMPGTHAGLAMPVQFIGGMMMVVRAEVGGWNLTAVQPQAAPEFGAALDFVALTPPQAQAWQRTHPREWSSCKTLLLGGGQAPAAWLAAAHDAPAVYEGFGMTETISHFAVRQLHPNNEPCFRCLPGFTVSTTAENALNIACPDGQTLQTNDAVEVQDAQSFRWLGRLDDVVNSGGIKIHPASVDAVLASAITKPFKCYGAPDPQWGEVLVLRIHAAREPENAEAERKRITEWARTQLPQHHGPKRIEWLPLESTASGKWKRPRK
jgi:O-succinylbenzoic acid--CoA ligase